MSRFLLGHFKDAIIADKQITKVITAANHEKMNAHDTPERRLVSEEILKRGGIEEDEQLYYDDILGTEEYDRKKAEKERKQQSAALILKFSAFFVFLAMLLVVSQAKSVSESDEYLPRLLALPPIPPGFLTTGTILFFIELLSKLRIAAATSISHLTRHHFFRSDPQQPPLYPGHEAYARFVSEIMSSNSNRDEELEIEESTVPRII